MSFAENRDPSDKASARWEIRDGRLCLITANGQPLVPSAREVVEAQFHNAVNVCGVELSSRPSEDLRQISFARYFLVPQLVVFPPRTSSSVPASCLVVLRRTDGGDTKVSWKTLPETDVDQIIIAGRWHPISDAIVAEIRQLLEVANVESMTAISLRQYLDLVTTESEWIHVDKRELPDERAEPPQSASDSLDLQLQGTLYDYQQTGVRWLWRVTNEDLGCLLGDEMGLGKTVQIIALMLRNVAMGRRPQLVIAPATLLENWRREIARFAPSLTVMIHRGSRRTLFPSSIRANDVVITTFDTTVQDRTTLKLIEWDTVFLDEAQAIKNPETKRAIAVKELPRRVGVAITGTPVENSLKDLWSLMDFSCPGLLGTLNDFQHRFDDELSNASSLASIVTPLMLRRMVSVVRDDLPKRIDVPQPIELSDQGAIEYEQLRQSIRDQAERDGSTFSLSMLQKLRMFCTHPLILDPETLDDPVARSMKYRRLTEILEEIAAQKEKVLIFTSYQRMVDLLRDDLSRRFGRECNGIDGRTPVEERQPTIDRFSEDPNALALALNPIAAGTGLNITAANHVIHYNREWNPAKEDQATARAYRIGQDRPVTIHYMFHPGTVEEIINDRLSRKRALADEAVIGTVGVDDDEFDDIARVMNLSPVRQN